MAKVDKAIERIRTIEPVWNDLREQRVLGRIQEEKRARAAARRPWVVPAVAAAAAIAVAIGGVAMRKGTSAGSEPAASAVAPPTPAKMLLADGSEATLSPDANVKIDEQQPEEIRLTQSGGRVEYDVRPDPRRRFSVRVGDVTVRVLGTAFSVGLAKDQVTVHVTRGKVEVEGGGRVTQLVASETLQVAAYRSTEPAELPRDPRDDEGETLEPSAAPKAKVEKKAPTVDALLQTADEARASHRYDDAASALRALVAQHPKDPRVASALFTLGRVERARGRHRAAAEAFARCHKAAPHGALAEDAMAEEASSWKAAGDLGRARAAAKLYLARHPAGPHVGRMMPLIE
jgi:transmembrane sensor